MNAKKLGFGLMRLPLTDPNDAKSIDIDLTCKMVDAFIERGFTYFDTAWMYCGHASEDATRKFLVERYPRDSYTLAIATAFSMNSSPKRALSISTTTCFTTCACRTTKSTRISIALSGCARKRPRALSSTWASPSTTPPRCSIRS